MKKYRPYLISALITLCIMFGISFAIPDPAEARSTWVVGAIVACVTLAIPIYDINSWSLTKRTLVHFLAMVVTIIPLLMLSGWYDWRTSAGLLLMVGSFLAFGVVGFTVGYTINWLIEHKNSKGRP